MELQELKDSARTRVVSSISNQNVSIKRERDDEDDDYNQDQDTSSSHARASKGGRIGSTATANEMHAEEYNTETLMGELLCEKEQHIQEKQKNMKLLTQLRDARKKLGRAL